MYTTSDFTVVLCAAYMLLANSVEVGGRLTIMGLQRKGYEGCRTEGAWKNLERPMAGARTLGLSR
jgi:hypothetical protein